MFGLLGIATYGLLGSLVTALVGALLLLYLIRLLSQPERRPPLVPSAVAPTGVAKAVARLTRACS